MAQAASLRPSRGNIITAALGLALGLGALGAPAVQAQAQPVTRTEMHGEFRTFRAEMKVEHAELRAAHAELRAEHTEIRTEMKAEHAVLRSEIHQAVLASENRTILFICGTILGVFALFPFYLALLRRLMPGLFAEAQPKRRSGGASRPPVPGG